MGHAMSPEGIHGPMNGPAMTGQGEEMSEPSTPPGTRTRNLQIKSLML
jgi:hypothetical protein